jgi:hypothetical protein
MAHFLDAWRDNIDMIKIGDDLGTQDRLMISPRMYRRMLKPIHAELIQLIKEHTKAKVFFHTDGDVFDLIGDFIEIGVDVLNPIQTSAGKMADLEGLKREYGDTWYSAARWIHSISCPMVHRKKSGRKSSVSSISSGRARLHGRFRSHDHE